MWVRGVCYSRLQNGAKTKSLLSRREEKKKLRYPSGENKNNKKQEYSHFGWERPANSCWGQSREEKQNNNKKKEQQQKERTTTKRKNNPTSVGRTQQKKAQQKKVQPQKERIIPLRLGEYNKESTTKEGTTTRRKNNPTSVGRAQQQQKHKKKEIVPLRLGGRPRLAYRETP